MAQESPHVKSRSYDRTNRQASSMATRQRIVSSARRLMLERGYRRTSVAAIAVDVGVHVDTVYQLAGRKPQLLREVLEQAISGEGKAVPPEERKYVRAIRSEADAAEKLRIYAAAIRATQERLAPVVRVVREAAPSEPDVEALWSEITERRAAHMRTFVGDVSQARPLRNGLSVDRAADIVWALNSTDVYLLLTDGRGWSPDDYQQWLGDAWIRLLLD